MKYFSIHLGNFVFKGEGNSKSEAKNIAASLLYDAMSNNNQQSTSANSNHNGSSLVEEMEFESSNFIIPATDTDLNSAYVIQRLRCDYSMLTIIFFRFF